MDRVKPLKLESADTGGTQDDAFPTSLNPQQDFVECAGLVLDDVSNVDISTVINRSGLDMLFKDGNNPGGFTLTILAAGATHKSLIHFIDEGPADEFTTGATKEIDGGLFPTEVRWKRADTTLLVKKTITRSGGGATNLQPTPIVWRLYATNGTTVLATVSDAITYTGASESSRVRTIS